MVTEVALSLPILPAVTELIAESPAEPIPLPQDVLAMLEAKGVDLASTSPEMAVAYDRSLRLFSQEQASAVVRKFLTGYRFPTGRENDLTKKQKEVVRLRLYVLTYKEIAERLGLTTKGAHHRMRTSLPLLEPVTVERLENIKRLLTGLPTLEEERKIIDLKERGWSMRRIARERGRDLDSVCRIIHAVFPNKRFPTNTPNMERVKKIAEAFWENWNRRLLPGGDFIITIARQFGINTKTVVSALELEGVDIKNEAKKKRLLFMLEVAGSMKEPFFETAARLGVSKNTLVAYRRRVKERVHLRWATELARESQIDWSWEIFLPRPGREPKRVPFNIGARNKTVLEELARLDGEIAKKRRLKIMVRSAERLESLTVEIDELQTARQKYLATEHQFRQQYALPSMDVLEKEGSKTDEP